MAGAMAFLSAADAVPGAGGVGQPIDSGAGAADSVPGAGAAGQPIDSGVGAADSVPTAAAAGQPTAPGTDPGRAAELGGAAPQPASEPASEPASQPTLPPTDWRALAVSTAPVDRAAAEAAVADLYRARLGREPEIIWCPSPLVAACLIVAEPERFAAPARDVLRDGIWAAARTRLTAQLDPREFGRQWQAKCGELAPFLSGLITRIAAGVEAEAADEAHAVKLRIALTHAVHGQHDAAWLPLYEPAGLAGELARVARECGWWFPFADRVILTERPAELHLDDRDRLHNGDGPALAYPDGFALYSWRGTPLTAEFGCRLAATTPESIRAEENAELRRMMVEHYTPERFVQDSGARPVHQDESGKLWRIEMPGDEPIVLVEVVNSSPEPDGSFNVYFLRVPPDVRTAKAGVAWTFGLTEAEYQPLAQT